jgi:hypothetical protein
LSSCVSVVGATVGEGKGEAGGLTGTGTSGVYPSRSCQSVRMACILLGGASLMPVMASGGDEHGMVLETEGVGGLFPASVLHICSYSLKVLQGRADIPAIGGMEAPGFASCWFEMDEDLGAWWSHGGSVEKKEPSMDSNAESAVFQPHGHSMLWCNCTDL